MFGISLHLGNPFITNNIITIYDNIFNISKNKFLEIQIYKNPKTILIFDLYITSKVDHAGINLSLGLFTYNILIEFSDNRHWNYDKDRWEN